MTQNIKFVKHSTQDDVTQTTKLKTDEHLHKKNEVSFITSTNNTHYHQTIFLSLIQNCLQQITFVHFIYIYIWIIYNKL